MSQKNNIKPEKDDNLLKEMLDTVINFAWSSLLLFKQITGRK